MAHAARRSRDNFRIPALTDPPSSLNWISATLQHDLDVVGEFGPQLDAASTAHRMDCLSAGCQRFWRCHRWDGWLPEGQPARKRRDGWTPGVAVPHFSGSPIGEMTRNRIPLVPNARRFKSGDCIRVPITSVDQAADTPAMLGLRHASVCTSALNTIWSSSRLILPIPPASGRPARSPAQ